MCVRPMHDPLVLTNCQSTLMPPPARPKSIKFQHRSFNGLDNDQLWSPLFSQAIQNSVAKMAPRIINEGEAESDDEANKPGILPTQNISTKKRQSRDDLENILLQCEAKKLPKKSVMQEFGGEREQVSYVESGHQQRVGQPSGMNLDYNECRLYDKVSREKAGIFRSAKNYRQSVEKRRRLRD